MQAKVVALCQRFGVSQGLKLAQDGKVTVFGSQIHALSFCGDLDTKVIDSRLVAEGDSVRRRRECLSCGERFTTFETAELVMPHLIKRDGRREPFDEEKLRYGLSKALENGRSALTRLNVANHITQIAFDWRTSYRRCRWAKQ